MVLQWRQGRSQWPDHRWCDLLTAKPGVDAHKALRAIKAVLGSYEPKHEHKEAACAFMLSEWFDKEKTA